MRWRVLATVVWLGLVSAVVAAPVPLDYKVGQVFEISRDVETAEKGSDGSSGSSTDRDTLEERIVGISSSGLEVEYDLPKNTSAEDRARQWRFPARVLRPPSGPIELLSRPELSARAAAWLKTAGLTNAACGHWYFTWNAFQIECNPQSVIQAIESFDLGPRSLTAGEPYRDTQALSATPLRAKAEAPESKVLYAEMIIDPNAIRRGQAEADLVTAEIMKKPMDVETALHARSAEEISGKITVTFEVDAFGHAQRQTKVTVVNMKWPDGLLKTRTVSQTLERKLLSE